MKDRKFFENPLINQAEPLIKRLEVASEVAIQIGQRTSFPEGLSVGQAALVAIREAGCGGFDAITRRNLRQLAIETNKEGRK